MSYERMLENLEAQIQGPAAITELKQTRFVEGLLEGKTGAVSAKEAGYGVAAQRTPGKIIPPDVLRTKMQAAFKRKGVTFDRIAGKLSDMMDAPLVVAYEGAATVSQTPDHRAQAKAIDQVAMLMGMQDAAKQTGGQVNQIVINVPSKWASDFSNDK